MKEKTTFLITGSSSGIGRATAVQLLEAGHTIVGIARRPANIEHSNYRHIEMDLGQLDTLPEQLDKLTAQYPQIDGIIFCAGYGRFGSLEEFSYNQIQSLLDLNLNSQIWLTRTYLPLLKKQNHGELVFIGSEAALNGGKRGAVYCAAKFGLRGFTQALRQECASSSIRVTLINPGMVRTDYFGELDFKPGAAPDNAIEADDVAQVILDVLNTRPGTVIDEINLSPQKKVIQFGKKDQKL